MLLGNDKLAYLSVLRRVTEAPPSFLASISHFISVCIFSHFVTVVPWGYFKNTLLPPLREHFPSISLLTPDSGRSLFYPQCFTRDYTDWSTSRIHVAGDVSTGRKIQRIRFRYNFPSACHWSSLTSHSWSSPMSQHKRWRWPFIITNFPFKAWRWNIICQNRLVFCFSFAFTPNMTITAPPGVSVTASMLRFVSRPPTSIYWRASSAPHPLML